MAIQQNQMENRRFCLMNKKSMKEQKQIETPIKPDDIFSRSHNLCFCYSIYYIILHSGSLAQNERLSRKNKHSNNVENQ